MAKPELRDHRKFLKLVRLLGDPRPHVMGYLECLWLRGYQVGTAFVGDADDVEAAAEYPGERGRFAAAAFEAGFLDRDADGTFLIHDLYDHAPKYAQMRMRRKGNAPAHPLPNLAETVTDVPDLGTTVPGSAGNGHARATEPRTQIPEPRSQNPEPKPKASGEGSAPPARRFVPPTVAEVADYCRARTNDVDPERFVDFYASKGWKVGSEPMKDWRACVRTWEKRGEGRSARSPPARGAVRDQIIDATEEFLRRGQT